MLSLLFASLIIGAFPGGADIPPMRVALLPFEDRAGFQGEWELARDVPELLGVHLSALPGISVVSIDALQEAVGVLAKERLKPNFGNGGAVANLLSLAISNFS